MSDPWAEGEISRTDLQAVGRAVGDVVRRLRLAAGLLQPELAAKCQTSPSVISRLETSVRADVNGQQLFPRFELLLLVCSALGVRLSDVLSQAECDAIPELPGERWQGKFRELMAVSHDQDEAEIDRGARAKTVARARKRGIGDEA